MGALHLISVPESRRSFAERPATFRTKYLYPVGHKFIPTAHHMAKLLGEAAEPARRLLLIGEDNTNSLFLAPDNPAMLSLVPAQDVQRNFVGNANRASNLESGSDRGHVANCTINGAAVELNRSGL
jgi:hypothetical protein